MHWDNGAVRQGMQAKGLLQEAWRQCNIIREAREAALQVRAWGCR